MRGERLRRMASHLQATHARPAHTTTCSWALGAVDTEGPSSDGPLSAEQVAQFNRDGFVNAGSLLTDADMRELTQSLSDVLNAGPDFYDAQPEYRRPVLFHSFFGTGHQIVNLFEASEPFRRLMYHDVIVRAVQQLMGYRELYIWHDQLLSKPANTGEALQWHQDAPLWPILDPEQSHSMVSAWIPFDNADASNGALHMVPGSHLWGDQIDYLRRSNDQCNEAEGALGIKQLRGGQVGQACPVRVGEVHFHHALTWHSSGRNTSERARRAHAVHYMRSDTRYIASKEHVMKQHVECSHGDTMSTAGPHFPRVTDGAGQIVEYTNGVG